MIYSVRILSGEKKCAEAPLKVNFLSGLFASPSFSKSDHDRARIQPTAVRAALLASWPKRLISFFMWPVPSSSAERDRARLTAVEPVPEFFSYVRTIFFVSR